ncbi:TonB-dependent receptor plug domain-containing protein [Pedobacter metabolipauper]|uniref:Outer membrane cobalamin receptor n=1 Tax=Pedobacter metabolipauper TaxID=425513 RepID=A0A4R6T104_9SPHI|nr:TonB-dependent receptor plug domain-containing protein [Pedobacter metabolipauper]TDQ12065.1 outer membrane cobalamin receptor [Pedobacter metabolipauper]
MRRNKKALTGLCHLSAFLTLLGSCLFMPVFLYAQTDTTATRLADSINRLKEVQIKSQKLNRRQTSSTPLQILSGADLERLNSLSVADAVRFFSGVQLKDYGGIGGLKTINVRSLGTNHTAVFYDGVQLGNAQNGQVDLGKYSLDNIEEIELYNGQKSTILQSARGFSAASSLYLKAKQPVFEKGRNNNLRAGVKTGSFGLVNPSVLWQSKLSNSLSSTVSAAYTQATGKYKFRYTNGVYDTTAIRSNGDVERMRLELGLNGNFADSSSFSAKVYIYNDEMGLPGAIISNKFDYLQRTWNRNVFVQSAYQKMVSKRYSILAAAKFAYDYNRYLNPENVSLNGILDNRFHQKELYLSLANQYQINPFWDVVLSTDYQYNTLDANLFSFAYPDRQNVLAALATRLNFNSFDIQANLLGTYVYDRVKDGTPAGTKQKLTPTVMLSWQPFSGKEFRIRSFYKHIFRMPTFNDLYYTDFRRNYIRPENTVQYDLGVTYIKAFDKLVLKQFSVQADVYYNKVKDKIVSVPANNPQRWSIENIGEVEIRGLDVNIQNIWQINPEVELTTGINYTYQDAVDVTPNETSTYKRQIPYIPVHSGSFLAGAGWRALALNYSFIYTGQRYNQKANILANYVEPWYTHDLALHYQVRSAMHKIKITAEVNNLLNQYYDVIANFPMPGRSYRFTLTYTY